MSTNLDSSIAFNSARAMNVLRLSFSSSLKVDIPFCFKPKYKWSVNFLQVFLLLKLRKTSYFHGEEENDDNGIKAIKEMAVLEQ